MKFTMLRSLLGLVLFIGTNAISIANDGNRHFTLKVLPLLTEKCFGCHGGDEDDIKGEFDVRTRETVLRGGESGEASIVPGKPDESPFYQAVRWDGLGMPPKENDRLTDEQILIVRQWIDAGLPWPTSDEQAKIQAEESSVAENDDGMLVSTSGGLSKEWTFRRYQPETIWAFRPVQSNDQLGDVPAGSRAIDHFIDAKLQAAGLIASESADPTQLLRRATLDLTGLPPSTEERKIFLHQWEQGPDEAWSALIDRLLASPHYGERWAQHWLDVVRYADTGGMSNDYERSNAWRYRDYVIRSFNEDQPYNEFVIEQIAGDELRPDDPQAVIATGMLRMGPFDTAMVPQEEARQIFRDDVVHNVGQSFLSMPMRCCKCHDHKFDPIPTRDYYRLYATFSATQPAEMPAEFMPEENRDDFEGGSKLVEQLHEYADQRRLALVAIQEAAAKTWYEEHHFPYKDEKDRRNDPEDMKPPRYVGLSDAEQGELKVREQDCWIWNRRRERYQPLTQSVFNGADYWMDAKKLRQPNKPNEKWQPEAFVFLGGSLSAKGEAVTPGVLSGCNLAVEGAPTDDPYALPTSIEGRRLALAKWIADKKNPLTYRSIINRLWQHHFGQGIVRTANNFGVKGDTPSHPELLDWLTSDFIENGFKIKRLHKLIMMSDAYRRSTSHSDLDALATADPDNRLLARRSPRRLTAEEYRDSLLFATGELNSRVGGLPMMPEMNMEVALQPRMIQFSLAPAYEPSRTPDQRNRRSIYAYRVRGQADPFLEVLNLPTPNESCETRDAAAVSPQAFTLLNSDVMSDRSLAMAVTLAKEASSLDEQVSAAFERLLVRRATKSDKERFTQYVQEMVKYHEANEPQPTTYQTEVTRSLVEEFSGTEFEYTEILPVFEDYISDTKATDVSAQTRALADLCLLLFNTNEYVYIY